MKNLEKQIAAFMRLCTVEDEEEREMIRAKIQRRLIEAYRPDSDIEREVLILLDELEVPDYLVGYLYITHAIIMAAEMECTVKNVSTVLYPKIADLFDTNQDRIKYAMRHLVLVTLVYGNREALWVYLGDPMYPENISAPIEEFIVRLANIVLGRLKKAA